jgi:hypothetical protein
VPAGRPVLDGTFSITALPPGRYLALAAPGIADGAWTEAAFLDRIRPLAESFSLGHRENRSIHLRLSALPRQALGRSPCLVSAHPDIDTTRINAYA